MNNGIESSDVTSSTPVVNPMPSEKLPIYKEKRFQIIAAIIGAALLVFMTVFALVGGSKSSSSESDQTPSPTPTIELSPTETPEPTEAVTPKTTVAATTTPTVAPTVTSTPTPSSTPTPTPTRTPNPPRMTISYPTENQVVSMSSGQRLCVEDAPADPPGDQIGIQSRFSVNGSNWTAYTTPVNLCFYPEEGSNTVILQYRNVFGEESPTYTRHFQFHGISNQ